MAWDLDIWEGALEMSDKVQQPLPLIGTLGRGIEGGGGSWGAVVQGVGQRVLSIVMYHSAAFLCITMVCDEWLTMGMPPNLMLGSRHS